LEDLWGHSPVTENSIRAEKDFNWGEMHAARPAKAVAKVPAQGKSKKS